MSTTKNPATTAANGAAPAPNAVVLTIEKFDLKRVTKAELHERATQQSDKARDLSQKLQEAYMEIARLKEEDQTVALQATVAANNETITKLQARVVELEQWPAIAQQAMGITTRMGNTLDKVSTMGEALVPRTVTATRG